MRPPTLHRAGLLWAVGDYPLNLGRAPQGWRVIEMAESRWAESVGLDRQRFETRRQCLEALMDAMEIHGAPPLLPQPPCRRRPDGSYLLAGGMITRRHNGRWLVFDQGEIEGASQTLRYAARLAQRRTRKRGYA